MKRFIIFFSLIVAMTALVFSATAIETGSAKNKASPVSVSVIQIAAENANAVEEVKVQMMQLGPVDLLRAKNELSLNFAQMQGKSTDAVENAEGQMNLNAQMTKWSKEQFCMMQALCMDAWRANSFSLTSTAAQVIARQMTMTNSTGLLSMMSLNLEQRSNYGASGGADQRKICSLNLTSAISGDHSNANIYKAEVTSIET